jgi:uncharacterized membrane protein YdbT with pleckstrin-like domain
MRITPDRRLQTKAWLSFLIVTGVALVATGIAQAAVALWADDADVGRISAIMWGCVAAALLLMWVIAVPITVLWIRNLSYEVTDDAVVVNKGILTKTRQNIPLRMVTDFRLQRSLIDRWLGIGTLLVQTAGQSANATGYEGRLSGLAEWATLHAELTGLVRDIDTGPNASSVDPSADLLAEVQQIRRLLEESAERR